MNTIGRKIGLGFLVILVLISVGLFQILRPSDFALFDLSSPLESSSSTQSSPCQAHIFEVKTSTSDFQVSSLSYKTLSPDSPAILIVPPTGGTNFMDRSYARSFCENGFDAYILDRWTDDNESNFDLEIHQRFYGRAQKAFDLLIEKITNSDIGIMGTSVGALHAAIGIGRISKLKAAFVITGGVTIPEVVVHSDQKAMMTAKTKRFKMYNFKSDQDYLVALSKALNLDPMKLPNPTGKKLGMVIATEDTTVPTENQIKLKDFWHPEVFYEIHNNHVPAIVKTWLFYKPDVIRFFQSASPKK